MSSKMGIDEYFSGSFHVTEVSVDKYFIDQVKEKIRVEDEAIKKEEEEQKRRVAQEMYEASQQSLQKSLKVARRESKQNMEDIKKMAEDIQRKLSESKALLDKAAIEKAVVEKDGEKLLTTVTQIMEILPGEIRVHNEKEKWDGLIPRTLLEGILQLAGIGSIVYGSGYFTLHCIADYFSIPEHALQLEVFKAEFWAMLTGNFPAGYLIALVNLVAALGYAGGSWNRKNSEKVKTLEGSVRLELGEDLMGEKTEESAAELIENKLNDSPNVHVNLTRKDENGNVTYPVDQFCFTYTLNQPLSWTASIYAPTPYEPMYPVPPIEGEVPIEPLIPNVKSAQKLAREILAKYGISEEQFSQAEEWTFRVDSPV